MDSSTVLPSQSLAEPVAYVLLGALFLYAAVQFAFSVSQGKLSLILGRGSLRNGLVIGLTLVGSLPVLALGLLLAERSATDRLDRMSVRMESTVDTFVLGVDQFFDKHVAGMTSSASAIGSAGRYDKLSMSRWLKLYHRVYSDYLTMLHADFHGDIITATSNMTGFLTILEDIEAENVADREYFRGALESGSTYVSDVFKGRGLGDDVIVAISAPIRNADGNFIGIVEGSLNLGAFADIERQGPSMDGAAIILVDQQNRVIYSSENTDFTPLQTIASEPFIDIDRETTPHTEYVFRDPDTTNEYLGVSATTRNGWRAYLRVPLKSVRDQVLTDYKAAALIVLLSIALSWLLAAAIVRRVSYSIADMNRAVTEFRLDGSGGEIRTPLSTFREFRPVYTEMRRRAIHLRQTYKRLRRSVRAGDKLRSELNQAVTRQEVEIAERTAALEEANEHLTGLSKLDPLTGIANRREFDDFQARVWRLAARDGLSVAFVLLDADFFKIYNDRLGHQAGDECLKTIATTLSECAGRPLDLVARYGGEEFVAVLGGSTITEALVVADRMRRAVAALELPHPASSQDFVTISCGAAAAEPCDTNSARDVLGAADEALYYAKAAGRNCVVFRKGEEFVTYDMAEIDLSETNVLSILAARRS